MAPTITLHALAPSHPCMTVAGALRFKGLEYERIDFRPDERLERMAEIYGEGRETVPGLLIGDEPVHGSVAILARLEELAPDPTLYPSGEVREAELWGDAELQPLGRSLTWGALHFRPESLGTFGGRGQPLDGPGTDFAIKAVHHAWTYHQISAQRLHEDLAGLPAKLAHIEELAGRGVLGDGQPTAAGLQIGATIRVLLTVGDLRPLLDGSAAQRLALELFPEYRGGEVPAGAFPAGWTPAG